jgi:hypothetical protein
MGSTSPATLGAGLTSLHLHQQGQRSRTHTKDMPRHRERDATLKLDSLRAQHTVNNAIGKLWQLDRRPRRRLSAFQAYFEDYLRTQTDDDARSDLSPTPSPRASPPPERPSQRRVQRRRQRAEEHQIWCLSERYRENKQQKEKKEHSQTAEDKQHQMVTRAQTTTRTRFYRLRLPT